MAPETRSAVAVRGAPERVGQAAQGLRLQEEGDPRAQVPEVLRLLADLLGP